MTQGLSVGIWLWILSLLGAGYDSRSWVIASCVAPEIKAARIGFPDAVHAPVPSAFGTDDLFCHNQGIA
jgi:hypothetical protein